MWLYLLPDEIQEKIYKEVYYSSLREIEKLKRCDICKKYDFKIKNTCILCKSNICDHCWIKYSVNYKKIMFYKYKSYPFFNCKNC